MSTTVASIATLSLAALISVVAFHWLKQARQRAREAQDASIPSDSLSQPPRRMPLLVLGLLMASTPFWFGTDVHVARGLASFLAVMVIVKLADVVRRTYRDRSIEDFPRRFFVWWFVAPETRWTENPKRRREIRRIGLYRLGRGIAKLLTFGVLVTLEPHLHPESLPYAALVFVTCFQFYFFFAGLADVYSAPTQIVGFRTADLFNAPYLASSPADFWSRRWNLFIARAAAQHIFFPLAGSRHRLRGTLLVFLASGLMHEYFVIATLGYHDARPGFMLAFFAAQGFGVMVHHLWLKTMRRRGRLRSGLGILLHTAWLLTTTPLFFTPLAPLLEIVSVPFRPL